MFISLFLLFLSSAAQAKTLHLRVATVPATLDWNGLVQPGEAPIVVNVCEGLYTFQYPGEKLVPGLSMPVVRSKDLTQYTFKIREGAKWSDGRAIYAQDFVESWQRVLSPDSLSIYPYYFFDIVNAREYHQKTVSSFADVGIKATDDRTLVVKFKNPVKNWEMLTTFWPFFPVRKDMIEKFGNNWWRAGIMAASGPFEIESYEPGLKMILKRNPYYPKTKSNIDEVEIDFIENHETAFLKYDAKEFYLLNGLPFSNVQSLSKRADFKVGSLYKKHMLSMNVDRFPTNNREFRLALLQAIDPAAVIPKGASQLELTHSLVPLALPGGKGGPFIKFDVASAKEHLKKSGIVIGKSFKLQLLTSSEEPFSSSAIEVKNQLEKNLGIPVNLAIVSNQDLTALKALRDFHLIDHSQTIKVSTDTDILKAYSSDSIANERHYSNPTFDQWLEIGKVEDAEKTLIGDEGVSLPLYDERNVYLMSPKLKGVYLNSMGFFILKNAVLE